ncbi:LysM peptidoglycan-binding domain-containing protein [Aerococcaceae bacterium NML130460]|nr:LysM peptidoglycan-binding domain-containing protein [Aerococcaceae bacterium NML130460]
MKLLRKSKGKWIAVAGGISIAASMLMTNQVFAEAEQPQAVEMQPAAEAEATTVDLEATASTVLETETSSESAPVNEAVIVAEQQAAVAEITATWQANTVQNVQQEIERQEALKLPEYVIQWGDTLSTIATASNTTVDELVNINQIANRDLIITGHLLKGVLSHNQMINNAGTEVVLERERQASFQKVTPTWTANSDDKITQEIERQEALKLPEYVIQWGDTLGAISRVSGISINELATLNNIQSIDLIITGNTLKGVLKAVAPSNEQPTPPVTPAPAPEVPTPPVIPAPTPEEPTPPVTPAPAPEVPTPPVTPAPAPEVPTPPITPTPTPEEPTPPVTPAPAPEEPTPPVSEVPKTAPKAEEKPYYPFEVRVEERREPLAVATEVVEDATLPEGEEVVTEGQAGAIIRTFEIVVGENNTVLAEKEANVERIAPVNKVVRRGAVVDRSRLQAAIANANAKTETNYTNASWAILEAAINGGTMVHDTRAITQQQADAATTRLEAAIASLQLLKEKPILTLTQVETNELQRSATARYELTDVGNAHVRSEVKVYRDGQLVKTQAIHELQAVLDNLELDTPYEIESILIFDRGNGEEQEVLSVRTPVELQLKRIELKDIQDIALMQHTDGQLSRVLKLTGQEDASEYVVRIKSANTKDMLLPVAAFKKEGDAVKVSVNLPQLVQREGNNTFSEHFEFNVDAAVNASPVVVEGKELITSFANLVAAMAANPTGHYILGADVSATEVAVNADSAAYVTETFRGSLTAFFQGKQYSIYDLAKPLFRELNTANISKLQLKEVDIQSKQTKAAPLAISIAGSTVSDVLVEGNVVAQHHVAGIVNEAKSNSRLENVAFKGELRTTTSINAATNVGGIVGYMQNSNLNKAAVDATITVVANHNNNRAGGVVGHADHQNTMISNAYAKGVMNNVGTGGQIGGFVGSTWRNARVNNVISLMNVINGHTFFGDSGYKDARVTNAHIVEGISAGKESLYAQNITKNEARAKIQAYDVSMTKQWEQQATEFDYNTIQGAQPNRLIAYRNTEKLLPFYNREYIVKQGNKINASSKLATTDLVSVVPMQDNRFVTNYYSDVAKINRLLLHFADGTVEYVDLTSGTQYKDSAVYEYQLTDTDLIYTPNQFIQTTNRSLSDLVSEFGQLNYMDVVTSLFPDYTYPWSLIASQRELMPRKNQTPVEEAVAKLVEARVDPFYLASAFKRVQDNIEHYLNSLLAQSMISNVTEANASSMDYLVESIRANKQQIIMSLAYIDRLYSIDFGDKNIGDLSLFRQDFLGKKVNVLDWLIQFGNSGKETFYIERNYATYAAQMGRVNGKYSVHDYLDAYRTRLTTQTPSDWLKSATKAYLVEKASKEPGLESAPVDVYHALTKPRHRFLLLPLLTLSGEGIYVISTMSSITFGMYDRYMDMNLAQTNPTEYASKMAELKAATELEGERERRFFDMWYRLSNENVKQTLLNRADVPVPTWDGYRLSDNRGWMPSFGPNATARMLEFFGPIGKWYRHNGAGAYAGGDYTHFVHDQVLSQYGNSVFTHEMTHNFDNSTFLGGYGRRQAAGAETYALGMFQSITDANNAMFGWNMALDHTTNNNGRNAKNRLHNLNPERFQNQADLQEYFKGVFDVIYTLDAIEGEAFLKAEDHLKRAIFKTLTLEKEANGEGVDRIRSFTNEEWQRLSFTTLADLVNNDVVLALNANYTDKTAGRNTYQTVSMFVPIYGAVTNDTGIAGNISFKRLTFDILAEKGYEGMLGYNSNKYLNEAKAEGKVFSDQYVVEKLFDGKYANFKDFKLDMLTRRLDAAKAGQLREIEFTYEGKKYTTSYESIKELIEKTAQQSPNKVQQVKEAIYRAYLLDTDDFRSSIYKAQP